MAQNVFDATFDANNRIDVNSFDWSHVNNLTTDFGRITPVFCELVPAKGSLRINPEFGLELMPMVFPVQTRMFARLNFFKVTLRSMWEDYSDFISNFRDDLEEPYINCSEVYFPKMFTTGSLGDYLGIPTRKSYFASSTKVTSSMKSCSETAVKISLIDSSYSWDSIVSNLGYNKLLSDIFGLSCVSVYDNSSTVLLKASSIVKVQRYRNANMQFSILNNIHRDYISHGLLVGITPGNTVVQTWDFNIPVDAENGALTVSIPLGDMVSAFDDLGPDQDGIQFFILLPSADMPKVSSLAITSFTIYDTPLDSEITYTDFPFKSQRSGTDSFPRLLAYRFRAYESVYNAYYRDIRNNPFVVNGRPVYNKWLPSMKGGADDTLYTLHQCNWERDFLTTAVPNPQQGVNAPLVGLTVGDVVTRSEDGTYSIQKQTVLVDEDGSKYGVSYKVSEDGERLVGVDYDPVSEKTPVTAINSYAELAALATEQGSGFTIETLRYVNAYQKFLELNMRKGFSYKQIMQGRWDIDIRFDELLMPEFIGGISRELSMRTVEQTVDQQSSTSQGQYAEALGSKTGIAGVYGSTSNNIEVFCDEESYIIGLLTVTPVPIYTQLLPKDFTYNGLLDHYQPEFDRIGFQPVTYKEICPLNVDSSTIDHMNQTFGYQRPWYEYVAKYDNAHGLFRTNMKNFIMNRTFSGLPQLGQQFLLVDPDTVNQVFSVTQYTDKIFGYVKFNATARLPISRVAIPRLD
uniref:Major capsid protein n=1 Tax=Microviridae sp. ctfJJ5 TaxID=2826739 RepID=A0A8S5MZZ9_9VIRU|nr:MAG TPA: Major capsid protein [Microviridae sp. ctfJJ5]